MKKKILIAIAAMGMGMGLSTTASAGGSCNTVCMNANLHCNVWFTNECSSWASACERCQGHSGI